MFFVHQTFPWIYSESITREWNSTEFPVVSDQQFSFGSRNIFLRCTRLFFVGFPKSMGAAFRYPNRLKPCRGNNLADARGDVNLQPDGNHGLKWRLWPTNKGDSTTMRDWGDFPKVAELCCWILDGFFDGDQQKVFFEWVQRGVPHWGLADSEHLVGIPTPRKVWFRTGPIFVAKGIWYWGEGSTLSLWLPKLFELELFDQVSHDLISHLYPYLEMYCCKSTKTMIWLRNLDRSHLIIGPPWSILRLRALIQMARSTRELKREVCGVPRQGTSARPCECAW